MKRNLINPRRRAGRLPLSANSTWTSLPADWPPPRRLAVRSWGRSSRPFWASASEIFACGAARLRHPVSFFSRVGSDEFGCFCLDSLRKAGASTEHVHTVPASKTGVTTSLSTRSDRVLVTVLIAISELRYKDLDLQALEGHSHLHMTSFFLQTALRPSFPRILRQARKLGLTTSFDPNSPPCPRGAQTFGAWWMRQPSFLSTKRKRSS